MGCPFCMLVNVENLNDMRSEISKMLTLEARMNGAKKIDLPLGILLFISMFTVLIITISIANAFTPRNRILFDQIAKKADLICNCIVIDERLELKGLKKIPERIFTCKINKVFLKKSDHVKSGETIDIYVPLEFPNAPKLGLNQTYLLFLLYNPAELAYNIVFDEDGVFEIDATSEDLLNIHGFYIEDIKNNLLIVGPQHPIYKKDEIHESPPAYVMDKKGNLIKIVYPDETSRCKLPIKTIKAGAFIEKVIKIIEGK